MRGKNYLLSGLVVLGIMAGPVLVEASGIRNSPHDLSSSATHGGVKSDNTAELCVFCHTPHAASTSVDNAPLWNRSYAPGELTTAQLYDSGSLSLPSRPSQVLEAVNASDARLCLSCHDGTSMAGGLVNPPGGIDPTFADGHTVGGSADLFDDSNYLTNDHPIGMVYADVVGAKDGFHADAGGLRLFQFTPEGQSAVEVMWCASCHDVHSNANPPFLAASNAASALCLKCHDK
ncbi:cytochrome c3 family protein [Geoalkalibacter halelectricus]|uniref:cytochrome c3 family protein n=1 Tax=Geoalkalibacter halelectricus TaxID=2847045 RepID=UPI003D21FB9A